jgi:pimeloyl-ACP methyl ester carboxylesterase
MTTHYLEHKAGRVAYDDAGSGPLIICAPSMGDLRGEYRFLAPQLISAGYRTVCMDVRGHGESSTTWVDFSVAGVGSDLIAIIRELDAGPAVLIGTSMAAGAAVWAAAEAPELAQGIVAIGPFVRGGETWATRITRVLFAVLFSRPWGPAMWMKYYNTLYPTAKPVDFDRYKTALHANLTEPGRMEALSKMLAATKAASQERLPLVKAPTLVLMGSKDPDFKDPEAEAKWVADSLRGTYRMIDGAGHYPHAEMPEFTGSSILAFVKTLTPDRETTHVS